MTKPNIGAVGVWTGAIAKVVASEARAAAAELEDLGYGALWFPESVGSKEAFSQAGLLLSATEHIVVATGIANIWARDPMAMVAGANTLGEAWPHRFVLGIGVSTNVSVPQRGHTYERPLSKLKAYVGAMTDVAYVAPAPEPRVPHVLGSIGPKSLEFVAEIGWGAHTYFVPPRHTAFARGILGQQPLLAVEQAMLLEADETRARELARGHMRYYLERSAYRNMLLRLGYGKDELDDGGSNRLVDEIVSWGDVDAIAVRVQDHLDAGADHVCLQPIGKTPDDLGLSQLSSLAQQLF